LVETRQDGRVFPRIVIEWSKHDEVLVRQKTVDSTIEAVEEFRRMDESGEPVLVTFNVLGRGSLSVGAGKGLTVMCFQASDDPPYWTSLGDQEAEGVDHWFYGGSYSEFLGRSLVPKSMVDIAITEFIETLERPSSINWEEL
jgi:hypothetical protein